LRFLASLALPLLAAAAAAADDDDEEKKKNVGPLLGHEGYCLNSVCHV
jgi:hypothetical protein